MSKTQILIAGHGGQGILLLGDIIAYSSMMSGKRVAFTPSYGPEMRGGKAKCYVAIADGEIDSPIAERPEILLIMNQPSMGYENLAKPGALLIYNSSLAKGPSRSDLLSMGVPCTELADALREQLDEDLKQAFRDTRIVANSVMLGAFLEAAGKWIGDEAVKAALEHFLQEKGEALIKLNELAISMGRSYVRENLKGLAALS